MVRQSKSAKRQKKSQIIALRRRGFSYAEIKKQFPVSKSTLSAWLKDTKIPETRRRELRRRSIRGLLKEAERKNLRRIAETSIVHSSAMQNIKAISQKELWLMGIVLYWACGLEESERRTGLGVRFSNSDPFIIKLFLEWLLQVGNTRKREITFDLYLHESKRDAHDEIVSYWAKATGFPRAYFSHVYFQKNKLKRKRTLAKVHYGLMRVRVKASSLLSRQISGWIKGIRKCYFEDAG
ncbi:MAG: hypothetical protein A3J10_01695 [Candidatus Sungbacteria bacterium RIFCSPLOWO2_02_FULL_54_10]|nr:MAG: hypothetical protein A3J10_01695 [Candidatus Sungbacteria bacterium RIFCSPLOWO2_02_FULL_54_10]